MTERATRNRFVNYECFLWLFLLGIGALKLGKSTPGLFFGPGNPSPARIPPRLWILRLIIIYYLQSQIAVLNLTTHRSFFPPLTQLVLDYNLSLPSRCFFSPSQECDRKSAPGFASAITRKYDRQSSERDTTQNPGPRMALAEALSCGGKRRMSRRRKHASTSAKQ